MYIVVYITAEVLIWSTVLDDRLKAVNIVVYISVTEIYGA
jgi:hypothetical protein